LCPQPNFAPPTIFGARKSKINSNDNLAKIHEKPTNLAKIRKKIRKFAKTSKKIRNVAKFIKNYDNLAKLPKKYKNFIHFCAPGAAVPRPLATPLTGLLCA